MQAVDFVQGDEIDIAFDGIHGKEMPRDVEHRPAPFKARAVGDSHARHVNRTVLVGADRVVLDERGQQLPEGLDTVEETRRSRGGDRHTCRFDDQLIRLRCLSTVPARSGPAPQANASRIRLTGLDARRLRTGGNADDIGEIPRDTLCLGVSGGNVDRALRPEDERVSSAPFNCARQRNDIYSGRLGADDDGRGDGERRREHQEQGEGG
jgi:hypothetical protein